MNAKYKVTDGFGEAELGDIRECFILAKDGSTALAYHPPNGKHECGSFEIVEQLRSEDTYISKNKDSYVNEGYKDELDPKFYKYIKSLK